LLILGLADRDTDMPDATCTIDGFGPLPLLRPANVAELGDMVRSADAEGKAVYPTGGQTTLGLGNVPTRPGVAVDLRGLDQIVDFPARDMTVTVQAGMPLAALQKTLLVENLRLPIDVPSGHRATIGGIVSANTSGPRRFGYGTLRDYVIGISAVNDEGAEFKAGGRVVKNVAGYDICKLLVGSLGTLGVVTQVTFKLKPGVEAHSLVAIPTTWAALDTLLTTLHASRTRPICVEVLNRAAARAVFTNANLETPDAEAVVIVGYDGNATTVKWQEGQLATEVGSSSLQTHHGHDALATALVEAAHSPGMATAFKANLLPSGVAAFCQAVQASDLPLSLQAHAGNGIVDGQWGDCLTQELALRMLNLWREAAAIAKGCVVVTRCPYEWKSAIQVWGPPPADAWLMRQVKDRMDPRRLFNPGRFVDGI
jgi:glycolate oxidase FAD binding subunit